MNLSDHLTIAVMAVAPLLTLALPAQALDFEFTIVGVAPPPGSSLYGRTWEAVPEPSVAWLLAAGLLGLLLNKRHR